MVACSEGTDLRREHQGQAEHVQRQVGRSTQHKTVGIRAAAGGYENILYSNCCSAVDVMYTQQTGGLIKTAIKKRGTFPNKKDDSVFSAVNFAGGLCFSTHTTNSTRRGKLRC